MRRTNDSQAAWAAGGGYLRSLQALPSLPPTASSAAGYSGPAFLPNMPSGAPIDHGTLFLPTRISASPNKQDSGCGSRMHEASPESPVRWTAQPVVEWIESLAAATEAEELKVAATDPSEDGGRYFPSSSSPVEPLRLDSTMMAKPSVIPPTAPWAKRQQPLKSQSQGETTRTTSMAQWGVPVPSSLSPTAHGWNLNHVHELDPYAWMYTGDIMNVAAEWEKLVHQKRVDSSLQVTYKQLQLRLDFLVGRILGQYHYRASREYGEPRDLLNNLYQDTLNKLSQLIHSVQEEEEEEEKKKASSSGEDCSDSSTTSSVPTLPIKTKKDLTPCMTEWLRENWVNPYPDEAGLQQIARECATTTTVVSNWLINARTRKWRPAILKAMELQRPTHCLLEDSIRIFTGDSMYGGGSGGAGGVQHERNPARQPPCDTGSGGSMRRGTGNKRHKQRHHPHPPTPHTHTKHTHTHTLNTH